MKESQDGGRTIPYRLYERLRTMITEGELAPDTRLREQNLERLLGSASRGPIREALRLLELKGLVSHAPRRGYRVVSFTEGEIVDLYELRAELEGYAIARLEHVDSLELLIDRLINCNIRMEDAFTARDIRGYLENNRAFHDAIVMATGNRPLRSALLNLTEAAQPLRFNVLSQNLGGSTALDYHRQIVERLQKRRFADATRIMRLHIVANIPEVLRSYAAVRHKLTAAGLNDAT